MGRCASTQGWNVGEFWVRQEHWAKRLYVKVWRISTWKKQVGKEGGWKTSWGWQKQACASLPGVPAIGFHTHLLCYLLGDADSLGTGIHWLWSLSSPSETCKNSNKPPPVGPQLPWFFRSAHDVPNSFNKLLTSNTLCLCRCEPHIQDLSLPELRITEIKLRKLCFVNGLKSQSSVYIKTPDTLLHPAVELLNSFPLL